MTDRRLGFVLLLVILLAAIGVGLTLAWNSYRHSIASPVAVVVTAPTAKACHSINGLPDPTCTPGVADSRVTEDNIHSTICVSGYTSTVRPSSSYTDSLKREQIRAYASMGRLLPFRA